MMHVPSWPAGDWAASPSVMVRRGLTIHDTLAHIEVVVGRDAPDYDGVES